jgi:hypothetical protein
MFQDKIYRGRTKNMKIKKMMLSAIVVAALVDWIHVPLASAAISTYGTDLQTDIQEIISLDCGGSTVNLGNITPGDPVVGSSVCTATTNANGGYALAVKRDDATDTTMDKDLDQAVNIDDKTAWDPTASAGSGNASSWTGTGLGFTVFASTATKNDAWWGNGTTVSDPANMYAGFAATQKDIMRHTSYSSSSTATSIGYRLDVPSSQKSGAYSGSITYQAITNP